MTIEITIAILIWTILSIAWFIKSLGNYQKEDEWYDYVLSPPVLIIAYMIGAIGAIIDVVKRKED